MTKSSAKARRPLTRSEIMSRVRSAGTPPELAVRSALHREGLRFRVCRRIEGVRPDVIFPRERIALFVDGCFWHCCPIHGTSPGSNKSYWGPKLRENVRRD